ncbi:putative bifunctional diguanylate cyclase/phosphodiesterase [Aphanothece sacrum]|uniref:Diguanylate cyclase n=1 Tax=Aphanothece sacrum FPU1 TaxID=1920663 RepID=A0A401IC53_APHSA|nr:diguanylate cyclase [Aphanothece sacrum FPU1]GBF83037.1 diguanylate cyclase [Aphanothece sacrum FPU3]
MLPFQLEKREIFTTFSIGLTFISPNYNDGKEMVRDADIAMGRAKKAGRGRYEIFDHEMHTQALKLFDLETDLRKAIQQQEFEVYYQSILCLKSLKLVGFEALIRWQHSKKGLIHPGVFIPVAEETGLIIPMGQIVLNQACHQLKTWQNKFSLSQNLTVSVNLSSQQLRESEIINQIDTILEKTGLESNYLKVEITESLLIENTAIATIILKKLRERNIAICLDDFGTGYSSLSYLHRFPVDTIKIDRSFINRIGEPDAKLEIVQSIITLAHNLGMNIVAEGIETQEQLTYLQSLQCDFGQGYFFSKPLNKEQTETLLTD